MLFMTYIIFLEEVLINLSAIYARG